MVIVPVLAPLPVAWVAVGFKVNDALTEDLHSLTRQQVSFLTRREGEDWRIQASTLAASEQPALLRNFAANLLTPYDVEGNADFGDATVSRVIDLAHNVDNSVVAVLQEPLSIALEPFRRLQRQLLVISLIGVVISIVASMLIARGIAGPVHDLARVARRIAAGDYSIIEFEAKYKNGKLTEQLVWSIEEGDIWRVAGYFYR